MNPYLKAAQDERQQIAKKLAELNERMKQLDIFISVAQTLPVDLHTEGVTRIRLRSKLVTLKQSILTATERMLIGGKRMPGRMIIEELEKLGIEITSKKKTLPLAQKVIRLSSILGKSGKFASVRGEGWALHAEQMLPPKGEAKRARTHLASVAA